MIRPWQKSNKLTVLARNKSDFSPFGDAEDQRKHKTRHETEQGMDVLWLTLYLKSGSL